jgi:hypothetical protein
MECGVELLFADGGGDLQSVRQDRDGQQDDVHFPLVYHSLAKV